MVSLATRSKKGPRVASCNTIPSLLHATRDPFSGLLFSQAGGKSCQTRGQQRTQTELQILFRDTDVDRCVVLHLCCDVNTIFGETQIFADKCPKFRKQLPI